MNAAVSAGGTEFTAVDMKSAQDKLKEAELTMHEKKYEKARRLAEQAEWDARLAERKAQAGKAEQALQAADCPSLAYISWASKETQRSNSRRPARRRAQRIKV